MKLRVVWISCGSALVVAGSLVGAVLVPRPWYPQPGRLISMVEAPRARVQLVTLHPAQIVILPRALAYSSAAGVGGPFSPPPWMHFAFTTTWVRALPLVATLVPVAVPAAPSAIFFPPNPPVLGAPPPEPDSAEAGRPAAPAELAASVDECFYAPLAARLVATTAAEKLSDDLRSRLEAYRATKVSLQTELRARIDTLREADAATREARLEEFSRMQTPRVAVLEQVAEQIRRDLVAGINPGNPPAIAAEAGRLLFAAFFRDGLTPGQRRLLREAAAESAAAGKPAPGAAGPALCFSPEGSRIRLPGDLPADLAAKIAAYENEKSALKQELRSAVGPTAPPGPQTWAELASREAPRMAALEDLAEVIRRGLAVRKDPARAPDLPPLSPELEARILTYRREKLDLQKALLAKVEEAGRNQPAAESQEKIREAIAAYTRENAARYAALDQSKAAIRRDLARLPNPAAEPSGTASADILLKKFTEAQEELKIWRNYRDYQIAVLQPGLSPEQRRLLFDAALEALALPLPGGAALP